MEPHISPVSRVDPLLPPEWTAPLPDHWRLARAAHVDLLLMGMPRVNLLLLAPEGVVRYVLESTLLNLREPVTTWQPGELLTLPAPQSHGTLILHDVGNMSAPFQMQLLHWLEAADRTVQVISTSSTPVMPRVQCGAFLDMLYYRLNTVCVDVLH